MGLYLPTKILPDSCTIKARKKIIDVFSVDIIQNDYQVCDNFIMWGSTKKGKWGEGLINSEDDKKKAERTGLLGEMAFAKVFGLPVNIDYCEGGKDYDFRQEHHDILSCVSSELKIDVKTAARRPKYNAGLVRCNKLKADIYVFAYIKDENRDEKTATVILVGWDYASNIMRQKRNRAKIGYHENYELDYAKLLPIKCVGAIL
jgi:hypothetical protein